MFYYDFNCYYFFIISCLSCLRLDALGEPGANRATGCNTQWPKAVDTGWHTGRATSYDVLMEPSAMDICSLYI